jgi:serine/threonine-protein kinase
MRRLLALAAAAALSTPAAAQDDSAALALKARKVLKQHCHACHKGDGSESGYRFDALDHAGMLRDLGDEKAVLVAGKPDQSRVWLRAGVTKTMPPRSVKDRPSAADLETLRKWIEAGAPAFPAPKPRTFVGTDAVLTAIIGHQLKASPDVQPHLRYFTLTHLHNNPEVEDEDLRLTRAALSKAVNSLTRSPRVTVPEPIDPAATILAVDIRELGWDADLWRKVLGEYPYGLDYKGSSSPALVNTQRTLDKLTHGELVHLRADWFVATATRPPLYYDLLRLPKTVDELERHVLRVNFLRNFQADQLVRGGFQQSGVSGQNRLVERHDAELGGYYWKSYDFKPRRARANLTRFPLGPEFAGNPYPKQAFQHDGGEMIFGLPNGMQGYFLSDGKGKRIDEGPTDVVSDALKTSGTPAIVNGTSCMHCHKFGTIGFTDTIREGNGVFGAAKEKVRRVYPEQRVLDGWVRKDETRFVAALEEATGRFLKVDEDRNRPIRDFAEPVGEATRGYLLTDVTLAKAAFELGLDKPERLAGMIQGNAKLREIGLLPLATGKGLKRDDWEAVDGYSLFQETALHLEIGTPITARRRP